MTFVGLDIETTGLHYDEGHRLIQIGISFHRTSTLVEDVRPWGRIVYDPEAMLINKFTIDRIEQAHYQTVIDRKITQHLKDMGLSHHSLTAVGWNVGNFDLPFIRKELPSTARFFSHRVIDLTSIAIFLSGGREEWRELKIREHKQIAQELGVENWHDAGFDALCGLLQWGKWSRMFPAILWARDNTHSVRNIPDKGD